MVQDPISGTVISGRGPQSAIKEGKTYAVIDMGRLLLSSDAGNYNRMCPGFHGRIMACLVVVETVTTDADADATIAPGINDTAVTGGVVTIADTAGTGDFDNLDEIFQGTLVTADNTFAPGDTLNIEYAVTNAFSDGVARVLFIVEVHT